MDRHICYNPQTGKLLSWRSALSDFALPQPQLKQNTGFVRGRLVKLKTILRFVLQTFPAVIKTFFAKSNSKGEFLLSPIVFPTTLKIRKFGYKDETIILDSPKDSSFDFTYSS